ncbi:unnamed protein product, partial [Polarella glacialis]
MAESVGSEATRGSGSSCASWPLLLVLPSLAFIGVVANSGIGSGGDSCEALLQGSQAPRGAIFVQRRATLVRPQDHSAEHDTGNDLSGSNGSKDFRSWQPRVAGSSPAGTWALIQVRRASSAAQAAARALRARAVQFDSGLLAIILLAMTLVGLVGVALYARREPTFGPRQECSRAERVAQADRKSPDCSPKTPASACATPMGRRSPRPGANESAVSTATFGGAAKSLGSFIDEALAGARQRWLCPSLVVPSGMELVFAVSECLASERQQLSQEPKII